MKSEHFRERVGVIDVGSNTIKLIVASMGSSGTLEVQDFIVEETRIGEGMTGHPPVIDSAAITRGSDAILRLCQQAELKTSVICLVATAAVRDATNKHEFVNAVEKKCNHELRVLSGEEEATLIGIGLQCDPALSGLNAFTVMDLGGGSLECIQFSDRKAINEQSLQLGAVRLTSLFVKDRLTPMSESDKSTIRDYVANSWTKSKFAKNSSPSPLAVITGGTSSILAETLDYDSNQAEISVSKFSEVCQSICDANINERISRHGIPMSRADIFPTALVTLEESLKYLGCENIRFSKYNLRYGVAALLLKHGSFPTQDW